MGSNRSLFRRAHIGMSWIAVVWLAVLALPPLAWSQTPQLHLVSTAWPPFTNPPGQPQFALDLVYEALKRIGVTAETAIVDESRFTPALLNTEFDGSAVTQKIVCGLFPGPMHHFRWQVLLN